MPIAAAIACGLVAALFYFSVLTGSLSAIILVYLVQLPLFVAGLALGLKGALLAGGTATMVAVVGRDAVGALVFAAVWILPVLVLVVQALGLGVPAAPPPDGAGAGWRRQAPEKPVADAASGGGSLATTLSLLGAVALLGGFAVLASGEAGFRGAVEHYIANAMRQLAAIGGGPGVDAERTRIAAAGFAEWGPALMVVSWLLMTAINGVLAQGALQALGFSLRRAPDIARLVLPRWYAVPVAASVALALLAGDDLGYFARNLLGILAFAYVFGGLAVMHAALRRYPARLFLLVPAYLVQVLLWPALLLAACGIVDQFIGLRRFLAAAPREGEQ